VTFIQLLPLANLPGPRVVPAVLGPAVIRAILVDATAIAAYLWAWKVNDHPLLAGVVHPGLTSADLPELDGLNRIKGPLE